MAQQMPPLPPQRSFSPFQMGSAPGLDPPPGGITLPPNKRQRLSPPNPSSPYSHSPTVQYLSPPSVPTSMPSFSAFHTAQPLAASVDMGSRAVPGTMGPPSRPAERADRPDRSTDLNQLSDIISASGIDVKEEENYLAETYRNQHSAVPVPGSFTSQSSATLSPGNSFNAWSQGSPTGFTALPGTGPLSQPPVTRQAVEDEVFEKHKQAARALSESQQQHLRDPFLQLNVVRHKLHQRAFESGVRLNVEGLFDKIPDRPRGLQSSSAIGPDGVGIVAIKSSSLLTESAPLVDVFALISLATQERLRGIAEDACAMSRGRQAGSDGVVKPEWASLAVAHGSNDSTVRLSWDRSQKDGNDTGSVVPMKSESAPLFWLWTRGNVLILF